MAENLDVIREFIICSVGDHPKAITALISEKFDLTRQTASYHLGKLVEEGILKAEGETNARAYELAVLDVHRVTLGAENTFEEHRVWEDAFAERLKGSIPPQVLEICFYGFTEMLNNAIDHSSGSKFEILYRATAADVAFWIDDDGMGIFNKIAMALSLEDPRLSLLELSKGKFTTDPARHTGEGIFFTSRAFPRFAISSHDLYFCHLPDGDDWLLQLEKKHPEGTSVMMEISVRHSGNLSETFSKFSSGEAGDYGFAKTHVPLKLGLIGDSNLVSRSQAKRVLARFDRFEEIMLDFTGVSFIGHSFADEIFRVFARQHPNIKLVPVSANNEVLQMIARAQAYIDPPPNPDPKNSKP